MHGWSEARIRAYKAINTKPNSYYYRFNAPGEEQRTGEWSKEEIKLFYKRLKEFGANGQWGLFSMVIPGRVGYQCSNFYRNLIQTGKIKDPNYIIDSNGKVHYVFKKKDKNGNVEKTIRRHSKHIHRKKSIRNNNEENYLSNDTDDSDGSFVIWSDKKTRKSDVCSISSDHNNNDGILDCIDPDNPLPGFIDPITLEEVKKPAISPYGHVIGYDNWVRCLTSETSKNICPFTKKKLSKRDLIILTYENIEDYRYFYLYCTATR